MKVSPGPSRRMWESPYLTFALYITAKNLIRILLHPDPALRPIAEQAYMAHKLAAPTEHDLCGLRDIFDPRSS